MDLKDPALLRIYTQITAGDLAQAHYGLQKFVRRNPNNAEAARVNARLLLAGGQIPAAIEALRAAVRRFPGDAALHEDLGMSLNAAGNAVEAEAAFNQALGLDENRPIALLMAADFMLLRFAWGTAEAMLDRLTKLSPEDEECWNKLAAARGHLGKIESAQQALDRAKQCVPPSINAITNQAMLATYRDDIAPDEVFALYKQAGEVLMPAKPLPPPPPQRRPGRIRVGYVSPDFYNHSVMTFFEPVLKHCDRSAFEAFCYYHSRKVDQATHRLRSAAEHWCDVSTLSDEAAARRIREDDIDLLIDLAGHTARNRLSIFGFRPGRVQATWLGWPATTGMPAMDFRVTDATADPADPDDRLQSWHSEQLLRLPETFYCYIGPEPDVVPAAAQLPPADAPITLAVPTNVKKIRPRMIRLWCEILARLPEARLVIQADCADAPSAREWILREFARDARIDLNRIALPPRLAFEAYLREHASWDIALDTLPFNGHTTTCHCLWMGIPIVTLAGQMHAGRMGASVLHAIGLDDLIANDDEQYIATAVALARDRERRLELRRTLRDRMRSSPLMNGPRFVRNLEAIFRDALGAHLPQPRA